jgi:hypothetical protein
MVHIVHWSGRTEAVPGKGRAVSQTNTSLHPYDVWLAA